MADSARHVLTNVVNNTTISYLRIVYKFAKSAGETAMLSEIVDVPGNFRETNFIGIRRRNVRIRKTDEGTNQSENRVLRANL